MFENLPNGQLVLQPPLRLHHLTGGVGLLVASNKIAMFLAPSPSDFAFFSLLPGKSVQELLRNQEGLRIIGRTHFSNAQEMKDGVVPNFAIPVLGRDNSCLAHSQFQLWSGIATALSQGGRDFEAMLASRLRSQIGLSVARLERLFSAYRTTLIDSGETPNPSSKVSWTSDKYASHLGGEYRSCLNELYSLRDAVLSASFRLGYGRRDSYDLRKMRALAGNDRDGSGKMIRDSMFDPQGDLLIDQMSLYRSLAQHCIGATNPVIGDVYQVKLSRGPFGDVPYVIYPLYDDIAKMREIEQGSSKGLFQPVSDTEAQRFMSLPKHRDALDFCFNCFERLLRICEALASEAGISPKEIIISDDEILEVRLTNGHGVTRHYKRDEKGHLREL